jgi:hypothetical protein
MALRITLIVALLSGLLFTICYSVFSLFSLPTPSEAAGGAAAIPIIGSPHIYDLIERLQAKKALQKNTPEKSAITIRSYEGFAYSWWVIVVCGVIIVVAVLQFAALVAGVVATSLSNTDQMNPSLVGGAALIAIPCIIVGSYLVGKWIGTRCARNEFITAILVSAVGAFASKALDYIFLAPAEFKEMFGLEKSLSLFLSHLTGAFVFVLVGTVLGVWRARRSKMSSYLQYLLRILPKETSATIVDLAYEEARRVR